MLARNSRPVVTPLGILVGTGLGAAVGSVTESLAVSTAVGAGLGLLIGLMAAQRKLAHEEGACDGEETES